MRHQVTSVTIGLLSSGYLGLMERGRWYPTLVPLIDGRLVVLAGFVGFDAGYPDMYSFENNHFVEFFETRSFNQSNPQTSWKRVNVKSTLNGPFTNRINADFRPTPGVNCSTRCVLDNQYDVFKLYEQVYVTANGQLYLTREGDFVSARTEDTAFMRKTSSTYHMFVEGSPAAPTISFAEGPRRPQSISSYGTTIFDPNSGRIALFGGQPTSAGTFLYDNKTQPGNVFLDIKPEYDERTLHRLYSRRSTICWRSRKSKTGRVSWFNI